MSKSRVGTHPTNTDSSVLDVEPEVIWAAPSTAPAATATPRDRRPKRGIKPMQNIAAKLSAPVNPAYKINKSCERDRLLKGPDLDWEKTRNNLFSTGARGVCSQWVTTRFERFCSDRALRLVDAAVWLSWRWVRCSDSVRAPNRNTGHSANTRQW